MLRPPHSPRGTRRRGALALLLSLAGLAACSEAPPPPAPPPRFAVPPDRAYAARRLAADVGTMRELPGGYLLSGVAIDGYTVAFALHHKDHLPDGPTAGRVLLIPAPLGTPDQPRTASFALSIEATTGDPLALAHLEAIAASVRAHDAGGFYVPLPADPPAIAAPTGPIARAADWLQRHFGGTAPDWRAATTQSALAAAALAAWLALLALVRRARLPLRAELKPTHLLPSLLQSTLLAYWSLYWTGVFTHLPELAAQLAFALALDLLLQWTARPDQPATVGVAVVPVVLSTNLFVFFQGPDLWLAYTAIAIALCSKHLIRRDGRHVFNPSALGVAITGAATLIWPDRFHYLDISHVFNAGPNMLEVIFLLGLIAQLRVPIVLVTLGATAVMLALVEPQLLPRPSPLWGPIFLALVLLITDPATIPRTPGGKLLFGASFGLCLALISTALESHGHSDFFSKVLPLPLLNLAAPAFDRAAARLPSPLTVPLAPRFARLHVAAWVALVLIALPLTHAKPGGFEHNHVDPSATPLIAPRDGRATCADNPAWCRPFSFLAELRLWR